MFLSLKLSKTFLKYMYYVIKVDTPSKRVENLNNKLVSLCKSRDVSFIKTFKTFLKYYAIKDGALHLSLEGTRRLTIPLHS
jgi:hypothetical protein